MQGQGGCLGLIHQEGWLEVFLIFVARGDICFIFFPGDELIEKYGKGRIIEKNVLSAMRWLK